jgi:hypothetical protein
VVRQAELKKAEAGLVPASAGWFVLNARDARWFEKPGQGHSLPLTGDDEYEAETFFPMLGMAIRVMGPGEPGAIYLSRGGRAGTLGRRTWRERCEGATHTYLGAR